MCLYAYPTPSRTHTGARGKRRSPRVDGNRFRRPVERARSGTPPSAVYTERTTVFEESKSDNWRSTIEMYRRPGPPDRDRIRHPVYVSAKLAYGPVVEPKSGRVFCGTLRRRRVALCVLAVSGKADNTLASDSDLSRQLAYGFRTPPCRWGMDYGSTTLSSAPSTVGVFDENQLNRPLCIITGINRVGLLSSLVGQVTDLRF